MTPEARSLTAVAPAGAPLVCLIVAIVLFAVAALVAGWARNIYGALIAAGLGFGILALVTH